MPAARRERRVATRLGAEYQALPPAAAGLGAGWSLLCSAAAADVGWTAAGAELLESPFVATGVSDEDFDKEFETGERPRVTEKHDVIKTGSKFFTQNFPITSLLILEEKRERPLQNLFTYDF